MDVIGQLIEDVQASAHEPAKIATEAGISPSRLSEILARTKLPTVPEYFAIRRVLHPDSAMPDEAVADLERLRTTMAEPESGDRSQRLEETLKDLLRTLDRGRE